MSTGVTAKGYPYPNGDDRVSNGDNMIKALADAITAKLATQLAAGQVTISLSSAASANLAVSFPVGIFTAAPRVVVSVSTGTTAVYAIGTGITASGFTATLVSRSGSAITLANITVDWFAIAI